MSALDLRGVTLVCQDWGGLIGLRVAAEHPERFARIVVANTFLPTGDGPPGEAFLRWQEFSQKAPELHVGRIVNGGCHHRPARRHHRRLRRAVPRRHATRPARASSRCSCPRRPTIPHPRRTGRAWDVLRKLGQAVPLRLQRRRPDHRAAPTPASCELVPGTKGQPHTTIAGGGHFLQEDRGEELARVVVDFIARTPAS